MIEERRESGADRWDEVWDGVYVMNPLPNNVHQELVGDLYEVLKAATSDVPNRRVFPGVNVSDQTIDWRQNYRCPDVAVYFPDTKAEDRDTYWLGGPDFAVEVASPGDRAREKLEFYAKVGTRELLIVDRNPWGLELWKLVGEKLVAAGQATLENRQAAESDVLRVAFRLTTGDKRPMIEVSARDGRSWRV